MQHNTEEDKAMLIQHNTEGSKLPVPTRWVTAAKAAIPLVKQNAWSALSSLARILEKKDIITQENCKCIAKMEIHLYKNITDLSKASLVGFPLRV